MLTLSTPDRWPYLPLNERNCFSLFPKEAPMFAYLFVAAHYSELQFAIKIERKIEQKMQDSEGREVKRPRFIDSNW